jgi:ubiquinone/menaquinone biosynthesis C-methylase UbiE
MTDEKRMLQTEKVKIHLEPRYGSGDLILDVGGGGEGIIGRIYGKKVVAIDRLKEELEEVRNDSLKIVMDASSMNFLDNSFDIVTAFFSLMYMSDETKEAVLKECRRVLKPNGRIDIWDAEIPRKDNVSDIFMLHLEIEIPGKTVNTGYGVRMNDLGQSYETVLKSVTAHGFRQEESERFKHYFHISGRKE